MHWAHQVPKWTSQDGKSKATVWIGDLFGVKGGAAPPKSWAFDPHNDVALWHLILAPGARITLPPARTGANVNRAAYVLEGSDLKVDGKAVSKMSMLDLEPEKSVELSVAENNNNKKGESSEILVLQGRPIGEPVA